MDTKITTPEQLRCLQELFPFLIQLPDADCDGFKVKTAKFCFFCQIEDIPDLHKVCIYQNTWDLLFDLMYNFVSLKPEAIMDTKTNNFDIQHEILDAIFQGILILEYQDLTSAESELLKNLQDQVINFLRTCRDQDRDDDFLFNTLLREIDNGVWRTNVYFYKY